ncbi:MAG: hypothetical protein GY869_12385 [Planctomycetes bacterium]|nr:hypothetical protein [Planctomycetota bacterium]
MTSITVIITILCILLPSPAAAQIIYVDAAASPGGAGSSWSDAYQFLQDALAVAAYGDEIRVAQGTYYPDQNLAVTDPNGTGDQAAAFNLLSGVTINGGYAGSTNANPDNRDIIVYTSILSGDLNNDDTAGWDPNDLINDPNRADNSYHIITADFVDPNAVLDGFTITAGHANAGVYPHDNGGAIYSYVGNFTLNHCTFERNAARFFGGALFNQYSKPTLNNCTFSDNAAKNGGAIQNNNSSAILNSCTFKANFALQQGGALRNHTQSHTVSSHCTFSGNQAIFGGANYNYSSDPNFFDCTFIYNVATSGGGMYNYNSSSPIVTRCLFDQNTTNSGGGMSNHTNSKPVITNCTFINNLARSSGGGIYNYNNGNPVITNTILWYNRPNELYVFSSTPAITYSNIQGGYPGLGNLDSDPLFTAKHFSDNQTPTDPNDDHYVITDYHLQSIPGIWDPNAYRYRTSDFNDDGLVNLVDYAELASAWTITGETVADLNHNGTVELADLVLFSSNYLTTGLAGGWVVEPNISPCIDAGSPGYPLRAESNDPANNLRINMGIYGGTDQATLGYHIWSLLPDITNDGTVNLLDLHHLFDDWLTVESNLPSDLNRDGAVNMIDYALMTSDWLQSTSWYIPP